MVIHGYELTLTPFKKDDQENKTYDTTHTITVQWVYEADSTPPVFKVIGIKDIAQRLVDKFEEQQMGELGITGKYAEESLYGHMLNEYVERA